MTLGKKKNIGLCIVLSIVTCGLYGLYWFITVTDDVNYLSQDQNSVSGGLALVFDIISCGIYGLYWAYKMGNRAASFSRDGSDNGMIYLLLSIFGLQIIVLAILQDTINKGIDDMTYGMDQNW